MAPGRASTYTHCSRLSSCRLCHSCKPLSPQSPAIPRWLGRGRAAGQPPARARRPAPPPVPALRTRHISLHSLPGPLRPRLALPHTVTSSRRRRPMAYCTASERAPETRLHHKQPFGPRASTPQQQRERARAPARCLTQCARSLVPRHRVEPGADPSITPHLPYARSVEGWRDPWIGTRPRSHRGPRFAAPAALGGQRRALPGAVQAAPGLSSLIQCPSPATPYLMLYGPVKMSAKIRALKWNLPAPAAARARCDLARLPAAVFWHAQAWAAAARSPRLNKGM